jgi:lysophospholipase L1-like esterase
MKSARGILVAFTVFTLVGCGGSPAHEPATPDGGADGGDTGAVGGNGAPLLPASATIGTYIVLGDSISDGGGTGPFFYDSLAQDLTARYPGLMVVHAAKAGAITDTFSDNQPADAPLLAAEIAGLGHDYPGDVLVTITIGGNDLNAHAIAAITGTDATFRSELDAHLAAELGELTTPGRLGSGKVYVVLSNIYDFTDGQGDFATVKCGPGANVNPTVVAKAFGAWNDVIASNITKVGGGLYDMHADFLGHGYNTPDTTNLWYDPSSCIHPNAAGHDAIRRSIYRLATGDTLP